MYFIKDINNLEKNFYKSLNKFIDPISLKEGCDLMRSILSKLFELRNSSKGVEKTIVNILIKDWLGFVYCGCVSEIFKKRLKKNLKFYNFNYISPNIDFFQNYNPSKFKSTKRIVYRFLKQYIDKKNILVTNLNHQKIAELNRKNKIFTNINSSYIEGHIDNKDKVYFIHSSDIFQEYKYFNNVEECIFTKKVTDFISKNFKLMQTYNINSYTYFFLSIKYVEYYLNYIMNNPNLIPKKLLVHNQKNIMDRIIINAMKSRSGKVIFFDHGGGSYYYNSVHNDAWSVDGNFYKFNDVDEFVTYSKKIGGYYQKIIPKDLNVKISFYKKKDKQNQIVYSENKVIILDYPIDLGRLRVPPFISEITRIRLMTKLIDLLKNKDLEILIKGHPDLIKETAVPDFILEKYKIKRLDEKFENLKEIPRNVIITYPNTTLFYKTMLMNYNIIFLDLGYQYQKECKKLFDERINIVKCKVKPQSIEIDEKNFFKSLKNKKICNKRIHQIF